MKNHHKKPLKAIIPISIFLFIISCAPTLQYIQPQFPYPQNPEAYIQGRDFESRLLSPHYQAQLDSLFNQHLFHVWTAEIPDHSKKDAYWAIAFVQSKQGYGENKLPYTSVQLQKIIENADSASYGQKVWLGMNVERTDLRALPTEHPFYYHFDQAGEGFPFDYLQNSSLPVNTPVRVVNQSRDKAWLLVESHHAMGWVPTMQIVPVDSAIIRAWEKSQLIAPVQEPVTLLDSLNHFVSQAKIGSVFPLIDTTDTHWIVGVVVKCNQLKGEMIPAKVPKNQAVRKPWPFTLAHAAGLAEQMIYELYGWGGYLSNRDCSAMIKDFYAPFGIWLPRHSKTQASYFPDQIELKVFQNSQKEALILKEGLPYLSLIYKPGHIMLFAGARGNRPVVFHNLWGLRTRPRFGREGRKIIGQAALTTLTPGKDLKTPARKETLLDGVSRITFVVHPDSVQLH